MGGRRKPERRVYPRGEFWWGVFTRDNGESKRESLGLPLSTTPENDALAVWLSRSGEHRHAEATPTTPRVGDLFDRYIAEQRRRGRAAGTIQICKGAAGHMLEEWGRSMPQRLITARLVEDYIASAEKNGAASTTIARELSVLRGALALAIHRGTFTTPLERVMPLRYDARYEPRTTWLTERDALRMYRELPAARRGWFAFALGTGARKAEVGRAHKSDIGETSVAIRGTKTKASSATIPITSVQRPWIDLALEDAHEEGPAFGTWDNVRRGLAHAADALSTCQACRRGEGPNCIGPLGNKLLRRRPDPQCPACRATPRVPRVTPNDLRRSLGMWLRNGGVSPHLIARVLRHTDTRMAEKVYARGSDEGLLASIEAQLEVGRVRTSVRKRGESVRKKRPMRRGRR